MAMMMEAPLAYPESPMEDDIAYPCKGCGKILEEGKAFELAGNRWHIDCFRCNTCSTLLDSDANLLLLGDGSLICNNCTYSCTACGNKIEDLAILTGDHAFCASCFRCRNCKKQIENLRYARTSQGIFCMECHEGLMARRRKKTKNSTARHKQTSNNTMLLDKSLPSLPPSAVPQSTFSPDRETPPSDAYSDTPTELPAHVPPSIKTSKEKAHATARDQSPACSEDDAKDNLTLPSTTYSTNRHSAASQRSNISNGDDFYIPMTLDPNTAPGPSPLIRHPKMEAQEEPTKQGSRDYFNAINSSRKPPHDQENTHPSAVAGSRGNSQPGSPQTPHIAYQEKGRDATPEGLDVMRKRSVSGAATGYANGSATNKGHDMQPRNGMKDTERFMLQEVPKRRKSGSSARNSRSDVNAPLIDTSMTSVADPKSKSAPASASTNLKEQHVMLSATGSPKLSQFESTVNSSPRVSHDSKAATIGSVDSPKSHQSPKSTQLQHLPQRGDSLAPKSSGIVRKEVAGAKWGSSPLSSDGTHNHHPLTPATSIGAQDSPMSSANLNGGRIISRPIESPISKSSTDFMQPPARAKDRPLLAGNSSGDSFVSPRAPPHPPMEIYHHKAKNESISTSQSGTTQSEASRNGDHPISPALPRYSSGGDFSMAEDMARILGNEEPDQDQASFLRRVSNSVRHGRSYSDRGTRLSREQKWPKSPLIVTPGSKYSRDGTPTNMSPEGKDDIGNLLAELRRLRQQSNEKDERIAELETTLKGKAKIKQMNTELLKKRSTMTVLDAQKKMVIRELEIMTEKIATAKKSDEPLDVGGLITGTLVEFAEALQQLKDSFAPQIEDLTEKKFSLTEDVTNLKEERERIIHELEQTAARNAQLADLNNQLVHQVSGMQGIYQQATGQHMEGSRPHGLGIYTNHNKDKSNISLDSHDMQGSTMTGSSLNNEHDPEHGTILNAPQVVNIRKAQPKKFNWKKGGQNVAKGVTKGLKGAFTTNNNDVTKYSREGSVTEGMPYGLMPQSQDYPTTNPNGRNAINDPSRPGFGFFGNGKPKGVNSRANGNPPAVVPENASVLFGSELEERAEYERINIPGIITRCIQEVELRGMDAEGIYRKSGGNSQILVIKEGFESSSDFDISDPDLDINAVTSTLKQYFRRLPTPLITYPVYDKLLDSTGAPDGETRIALMRSAINELPPHHRDCLEFLVFHLARVVERERENLMTSNNVAVVFAPTIMRPESIAREMSDTSAKNSAVQFLIENCQAVFLGEA